MSDTPPDSDNTGETDERPDFHILVPIAPSSTMRETIHHAVKQVLSADGTGCLYFVIIEPKVGENTEDAHSREELLDRAAIWAREELGDHGDDVTVRTGIIGQDTYVFSPTDVAQILHSTAVAQDIDKLIIDPAYDAGIDMPLLHPLEEELEHCTHVTCEKAPVTRQVQRTRYMGVYSTSSFLSTFVLTFLFYQILGGQPSTYSAVTGGITALVASAAFSRLLFMNDPTRLTPIRAVRFLQYLPFLLLEIVRSNLRVAALILHPRMPIHPRMVRLTPRIDGSLPLTLLATSITLTPGTLTARINGRELLVHTLDETARDGLYAGELEQRIKHIFHETQMTAPDVKRTFKEITVPGEQR